MEFRDFEPIFGQPNAECPNSGSIPSHPFLFHAYTPDPSCLRIHATDFHSNTWEAVRLVQQLDDMRDDIGIGGTWTEFVDYVAASLKSNGVKIVLEGHSESCGAVNAKLVAQKSRGMPLIIFFLTKLVDSAACEAIANVSLNLFKAFQKTKTLLLQEEASSCQLTKVISAEQGKKESIENQPELFYRRQKLQKINSFDMSHLPVTVESDTASAGGLQNLPDKAAAHEQGSQKMASRVVPTYRRTKVRGALLHDPEDDKAN